MGEAKLSEALNYYEATVLKEIHCFEAFYSVNMTMSAGQILGPLIVGFFHMGVVPQRGKTIGSLFIVHFLLF